MDVARSGLASLLDLQRELEEAAQEMAEAEDEADRDRAAAATTSCTTSSSTRTPTRSIIASRRSSTAWGSPKSTSTAPARTFSGGQQSRLMLAKLLLESPDLMLLDEPSNHLDIETTDWLENYLARQPVAMVVVSHDRYFLDKVVTKIWELHEGKIDVYPGNYTQYWRLRTEKAKVLERQAERQEEKAAEARGLHPQVWRGPARQAGPRPREEARATGMRAGRDHARDRRARSWGSSEVDRSGDIVIEARKLSKAYDRPLFQDLNVPVQRGQCVGVMGPNGSGKTTLIKTLIGREKPDSGEVKLGHKVQVGYHDQGLQSLAPETTVVRAVWPEDDPDWVEGDVRDLLARFGLTGEHRLPDRRPALRRREGQGRPRPALRHGGQSAGHGRADQPPRHLVVRGARTVDPRVRGDRAGRQPRPLLPQPGRRPADRRSAAARPGSSRAITRPISTSPRKRRKPRPRRPAPGRPPLPRPASRTADRNGGSKKKFPYRKAADLEREIGEVETELADGRRPARPARHLSRRAQGRTDPGSPPRAENPARVPLPALGTRRRIELVQRTVQRGGRVPLLKAARISGKTRVLDVLRGSGVRGSFRCKHRKEYRKRRPRPQASGAGAECGTAASTATGPRGRLGQRAGRDLEIGTLWLAGHDHALPDNVAAACWRSKATAWCKSRTAATTAICASAAEPASREQSLKPGLKAREELDGLPGQIEPLEIAGASKRLGNLERGRASGDGRRLDLDEVAGWLAVGVAAARTSPRQQRTLTSFAFLDRGWIIVLVIRQSIQHCHVISLPGGRFYAGLYMFEPVEVGVIFHPELNARCRIDDFMPEHIGASK